MYQKYETTKYKYECRSRSILLITRPIPRNYMACGTRWESHGWDPLCKIYPEKTWILWDVWFDLRSPEAGILVKNIEKLDQISDVQ